MPIIPIPGGARGYSFLYTRAGGASDDFVIALPKTMPNTTFLATVQAASGPDDFVDAKVVRDDNTTTTIHVVTASPIADGTQLIVTVNGVASRVMPVVVDGVTITGSGIDGDPLVGGSSLPDITDNAGVSVAVGVGTVITGSAGQSALEVQAVDPAWPSAFVRGTPTQADAVLRVSDVPSGGSGFRIDATSNGGIQVVHSMPADAAEWGIWDMQLVAKLGRQLFIASGGNPNLQQGALGLQTVQFINTAFAAGPGTLTIPGIAFPAETPGYSINSAYAHGGACIFISNYGGTADLILSHEDGSVDPTYRFHLPGAANYHVAPNRGVWLTSQAFQPTFDLRWFLMQ